MIPRHLVSETTFMILSPSLMGLSGPQKALWEMIIASDFPACIVSLLFLHPSEISERALFRPLTTSSTLLPMICSVMSSAYNSRLPSVVESVRSLM